jgi:hypothetical protein
MTPCTRRARHDSTDNPPMRCILLLVLWADAHQAAFGGPDPMEYAQGPYDCQVARQLQRLDSGEAKVCAGAAEALRFLRAYSAEQALVERLDDESADVRRQAAMALAWCSSRRCVARLLDGLGDPAGRPGVTDEPDRHGVPVPFDGNARPSLGAGQRVAGVVVDGAEDRMLETPFAISYCGTFKFDEYNDPSPGGHTPCARPPRQISGTARPSSGPISPGE